MVDRDEIAKRFGAVMKSLRGDRGWSGRAAARASGMSCTYWKELELGRKSPSLHYVFAIAKAFDVTARELMERVER